MVGSRLSWKLQSMVRNILLPYTSSSIRTRVDSLYTAAAPVAQKDTNASFPSKRSSEISDRYNSTKHGRRTSAYDYNTKMGNLGRSGDVCGARTLFDQMPQKDTVSYASMISIYLKYDEFHRAEELFYEIPQGMRSIVTESAMVHAYAKSGRISRAKDVFDEMLERNAFSWTSLISGYFNVGKVDYALKLFAEMPESEKNDVTWTSVITGLARNGLIDEAQSAFNQMPVKGVVAWTSMIKAYVDNDQVVKAFKLFHKMPHRNLYSWNIIISGLFDINRVNEAKELFDSMPWKNVVSWTIMVTGLARNGRCDLARSYFDKMPNKDVPAWNAMMNAYTNEGRMVEAGEIFNLIPNRNIVSWNSIIDGYAKDEQEDEAFRHFILMLNYSRVRPDETTLTSLLTSCSGVTGILQVHGLVTHLGFDIETSLANSLITMYYKNGDFASARIAFDNLKAKDVVTWTAMILAYSNHGFGMQALQTFSKMLRSGYNPDEVTFVGILSACSHTGLVKKGKMLFDSIKTAYGLEIMTEHYCCLVDMFGRAGFFDEAVKVVYEMPRDKYDSSVLGALLGALRLHGDNDDGRVADFIGDELIEMEPNSSGGYTLLANIYAASGKWEKFSHLKMKMKGRQVKKLPGFSQIEVNGKSHTFLVHDMSHPSVKEVYVFLHEKILPVIQNSGDKIADIHQE